MTKPAPTVKELAREIRDRVEELNKLFGKVARDHHVAVELSIKSIGGLGVRCDQVAIERLAQQL